MDLSIIEIEKWCKGHLGVLSNIYGSPKFQLCSGLKGEGVNTMNINKYYEVLSSTK